MTCKHCRPSTARAVENPFHDRQEIVQTSHDGVLFAVCSHCSQKALHFWIDVYDDCWHSWCHLTDSDERRFSELPKDDDEAVIDLAKQIIKAGTALQEHPLHGNSWGAGDRCVLEGAPW